jgi:hypothetical protein
MMDSYSCLSYIYPPMSNICLNLIIKSCDSYHYVLQSPRAVHRIIDLYTASRFYVRNLTQVCQLIGSKIAVNTPRE